MKISRGALMEDTSTVEQTVEGVELHVGEQVLQKTQGVTQPKEGLRRSLSLAR